MDLVPLNKAANDILIRLLGPAATEIGDTLGNVIGLASDHLRVTRTGNLGRILERAARKSGEASATSPHTIYLSTAVPLLEAASLCGDDGSFKEYWSSLIACAIDGNLEQTSYVHILNEMSPLDALLFESLMNIWDCEEAYQSQLNRLPGDRIDSFVLDNNLEAKDIRREEQGCRCSELQFTFDTPPGVEVLEVLENLQRLGLVYARFPQPRGRIITVEAKFSFVSGSGVAQTTLGRSFWSKCCYDAGKPCFQS